MKDADLIQALKRIKVQTGGLICLGCGHEHNCRVHGCAIIREAAQRLEERMAKGTLELGEPLTQADISQMDYEKIWIEYKDGTGEWALVYAGKIYNIDTLEGAGFGDMLQDAMQGERLDWPTGQYVAYRRGKERIAPKPCELCGTLSDEIIGRFSKYTAFDQSTTSKYVKARFCPECGRPLTKEAWDEMDRLRELVEADREGRVKILAPAMLATCGSCTFFRRTPGTASGICEKREQFKVFQKRPCCKMYEAMEDCK